MSNEITEAMDLIEKQRECIQELSDTALGLLSLITKMAEDGRPIHSDGEIYAAEQAIAKAKELL